MQRADISFTEQELKALWKAAKERDSESFVTLFSQNFSKNLEEVQSSKSFILEELALAAKRGNFDQFKQLFEKGIVDAKAFYNGKTFLRIIIKADVSPAYDQATIGRQSIFAYLLDHGADIYQESYALNGASRPSAWQMCQTNEVLVDEAWTSRLFSVFIDDKQKQFGQNIFPLVKAQHDKLQNKSILGARHDL